MAAAKSLRSWMLLALLFCGALTATVVRAEDEAVEVEDDADVSDDYVDVDEVRARLLVVKSTGTEDLVQGSNITFTVKVYNAGSSAAKGVAIVDSVDSAFQLIEGKTSLQVATIHPGDSVEFSYVAVAKESGVLVLPSVSATYTSDNEDDTVQKGNSLPKRVRVLSTTDKLYKSLLTVGSYATLGAFQTPEQWLNFAYVVAGIGAVAGAFFGYKSLNDANKRWKYQRALKEVEKMQ